MKNLFILFAILWFTSIGICQVCCTGELLPGLLPEINNWRNCEIVVNYETSECIVTSTVKPCPERSSISPLTTQMSVYPNPANTELFYTLDNSNSHSYTITDFSGVVVAQGEQRSGKVRLDLSNYQAGIYNLTITIGTSSTGKKFIIEKD